MAFKILFITRNYPPKIGGIESYSYNLIYEFEKHCDVWKMTLSKSKLHLLWFLPHCFFKSLQLIHNNNIDTIHLCDGLLAPLGVLLKFLTKKRVSISIHGLDITFPNSFYQAVVPWCVSHLDMVICVSRSTRDECVIKGVPLQQCNVIPNGVTPGEFVLSNSSMEPRHILEKHIGAVLLNKKILVTVSRLVKRKGVAWFVENVMPRLDGSYVYIVAGDGPEYHSILEKINRHNLSQKVFMLGKVSNELRNVIYNGSDIFILPNISVKDDVEGFGIVAIEAGSCGLPVVASNIQGIKDAVLDGRTGSLVAEADVDGFLEAILTMNLRKDQVKSIVTSTFGWPQIYEQYRNILVNYPGRKKRL